MNKTNYTKCDHPITVDINGLQAFLSTGRASAEQIASDAKAVVRVGRRKLYLIGKIEDYIENLSGKEAE